MKKRELVAPGFNAMTGYGFGRGIRREFGGMDDVVGRFVDGEVGAIDAPKAIPAGSVYASEINEGAAYQSVVMRGTW